MEEIMLEENNLAAETSADQVIEVEPEPSPVIETEMPISPSLDSIDVIEPDTQASVESDASGLVTDTGETVVISSGDDLQAGQLETPETQQPETVETEPAPDSSQIASDVVDMLLENYETEPTTEPDPAQEHTFDELYASVQLLDDYFTSWEKEEFVEGEKKPIIVTFFDRSVEHYQLMEEMAQTQQIYSGNIQNLLVACLICLGLLVGMQVLKQLADFFR